MCVTSTPKLQNQQWGIYYRDRQYARLMGDPLRTVVEAPTKWEAEKEAARLGFANPIARPITPDELKRAQWLPKKRPRSSRS